MFRINQVIRVGFLSIALASGVGCATVSGGHARGRDVHASARIAGDASRVLVTGPALLMHVDVDGRDDLSLYAVRRSTGTEADCGGARIGEPRRLRPRVANLVNIEVPADQSICVGAAPNARTAAVMWHARRIEGGAGIGHGEAIAFDDLREDRR
jgi:hypothetical protein